LKLSKIGNANSTAQLVFGMQFVFAGSDLQNEILVVIIILLQL
jgi:hypothetical protein